MTILGYCFGHNYGNFKDFSIKLVLFKLYLKEGDRNYQINDFFAHQTFEN